MTTLFLNGGNIPPTAFPQGENKKQLQSWRKENDVRTLSLARRIIRPGEKGGWRGVGGGGGGDLVDNGGTQLNRVPSGQQLTGCRVFTGENVETQVLGRNSLVADCFSTLSSLGPALPAGGRVCRNCFPTDTRRHRHTH